ncbi:MAG TPA: cbb3-type cytochrome c oxidase subunit II [Thermoanaerobaculia bacterium]|nr:cbb3-type cytochrome c oxidase subunit II [Thermoanaerobaculia bacterium]
MWREAWRGVLAVAATYVAFLLFAQFGFLSQVQHDLVEAGKVRAVMAAMGVAGFAASLGTAWLLGRVPALRLVRTGLGAVAAVAVVSVFCHGFFPLFAVAAAIGVSIGLLTVSLATALPEMVPRGSIGLAAGVGTGLAYLVSNVPVLFEAAPGVRALFVAGLAVVALVGPHPPNPPLPSPPLPPGEGGTTAPGFGRLVVIFLVLVWLDSAGFAIVQANPGLKDQTWGSAGQKIVQGITHLVAAIGAGALLDAGFGLAVPLASWVLFAVAFPLLQSGGGAAAGPIYAAGISLYSTALVFMPTWRAQASLSPRWRAGLLYGIAGWLGSVLGVGMAQDLGRIPAWFLLATGALLAVVFLLPSSPLSRSVGGRWERGVRGVRFLGLLAVALESLTTVPSPDAIRQGGEIAAVARGRRVYIAEGCVHCHSQYVRPGTHDESWWGPSQPLDRSEEPPLVGSRRQGPDLLEVGNRRGAVWQELHLRDPRALDPGSRMPSYAYLFAGDGQRGRDLVAYLSSLGESTSVEHWEMTARERIAPPPAPPSAARGAALFSTYCAACHGTEARGDGRFAAQLSDPYADLRKAGFHSLPWGVPEDEALARIVRHGLPPTSMPGHEWLTDQQVADLVAFVETLHR